MKTLALILVLFIPSVSFAGTITGTSTAFNPEIRQRLADYGDWAVWNGGGLQANITKGSGWINYSLVAIPYVSPPATLTHDIGAAIFNTGAGYYLGGVSYVTNSADGKGFSLTVPENYMNGSKLDLWIFNNGPVSSVVTASSDQESNTVNLTPYGSFLVSFEASGLSSPLSVSMVGQGNFTSAQGQMSFGAAALSPIVVSEPSVATNCLLTGFCLTPMLFKWRRRREQPNPSPSRAGQ